MFLALANRKTLFVKWVCLNILCHAVLSHLHVSPIRLAFWFVLFFFKNIIKFDPEGIAVYFFSTFTLSQASFLVGKVFKC